MEVRCQPEQRHDVPVQELVHDAVEWQDVPTGSHVKTGTVKDPRHTIRVAFEWDADERMVVIGFIGQHQRTQGT